MERGQCFGLGTEGTQVNELNHEPRRTGVETLAIIPAYNVEYATAGYVINVSLAVMMPFLNVTANQTQYRVVSQTPVTNFTFQLFNGGYWNHTYAFRIPSPGIFRLYFDLYKLPDTVAVYRYLFLTIFVTP